MAAVTAVRLLPQEAGTRGWADSARETFQRTGAKPFEALLDYLLANADADTPSRAAVNAEQHEVTAV